MAVKNREPMETLFDWPELSEYRGVCERGSDGDKRLCEARIAIEAEESGGKYKTEYASPLVDFGLVPKHLDNPETMAVTADILPSVPWLKFYDFRTSLLIDWRLRWCRCYLDYAGFPYDKEPFVVLTGEAWWHYQSEDWPESGAHSPTDSIDYTLQIVHRTYAPQWFSAKLLAHYRRANSLETEHGNGLGLAREWMLFGETWAEAKFLFNQEANAIRGARVGNAARLGGEARRRDYAPDTTMKLEKMEELVEKLGSVKGAAEALARQGCGTAEANRKLWNRSKNRK